MRALTSDHDAQDVRAIGKILGARPIPNALDFVGRHRRCRTRQRFENRRSRRSDHLGRPIAEAHRKTRKQFSGGGRRYRNDPVARSREARAHRQRRDHQGADVQLIERPRRAHDVDDRIDRPDLVEMHVLARRAMDFGLGLRQCLKDRGRIASGARAQAGARDHREDFAQMALRLRLAHLDLELDRPDSADFLVAGRDAIAMQPEPAHRAIECARVRPRVDQRAHHHIAAQARKCVEICRLHDS
jgi:hypothetical protein